MDDEYTRLRAKLGDMSNDEFKDFQSKNCLFCQICNHQITAKSVYEDETVLAILDINPANKGHVLLIPKEHYAILPQADGKILKRMFKICQKISKAMISGLKADGTNIYVACGSCAGQSSQHGLIHIIPRFKHDDLHNFELKQEEFLDEELAEVKELLT